jgi:cysteine desulfurase
MLTSVRAPNKCRQPLEIDPIPQLLRGIGTIQWMPGNDVIYLDYNASTPCDPRVVAAMTPLLTECYANPSSRAHRPGQQAASLLEDARTRIASAVGARFGTEITLTSGATEANNLAIKGVAEAVTDRGRHLLSQVTEHPSVLEPLHDLARRGWQLTLLPVDSSGRISLDDLRSALRPDTALVSVMLANNETGTVQPVREVCRIAHEHGTLVHCDAAQGTGKVDIDVRALGVDLATFSAHKVYGPKGAGCLYFCRRRPPIRPRPQIHGGGQETGLRSGTPNLAAAVAMARAFEIAHEEWRHEAERIGRMRDLLEERIQSAIDGCTVNGFRNIRLPGTSNLSFERIDGNALLASLPDLAISSGSACTSSRPESSSVLRAMGVPKELAAASVRFSLGRFTTEQEVLRAAARVAEEVVRLRAI